MISEQIPTYPTVQSVWVRGYYSGKKAGIIRSQAEAGIGYLILEDGGNNGSGIVCAFRWVTADGAIPNHLEKITNPYDIAKLEKRRTGH